MLFQVKQRYNEEDLRAFQEVQEKRHRVSPAIMAYLKVAVLTSTAGLIGGSVYAIWWGFTHAHGVKNMAILYLVSLIWLVLIVPAIVLMLKIAIPDKLDTDSLKKTRNMTITFEEDCFIIENTFAEIRYRYSVVDKFVEGEAHFFIYSDVAECFLLRKTCFTVGDPADFGPFLREKYRTKEINVPEE